MENYVVKTTCEGCQEEIDKWHWYMENNAYWRLCYKCYKEKLDERGLVDYTSVEWRDKNE